MRLLYSIYAAILICFSSDILTAQTRCASDDFLQERLENDEKFAEWYKQQIKQEKIDVETRSILNCNTDNSIVIPVAVHYNTPITCADPDCLLSQAEAQIAKMNEDFSANNADLSYYTETLNSICPTVYPLSYAPVVGVGTCIQFCLANQNHPACSELADGDPAITVGQYTWTTLSAPWQGYLNLYVSNTTTAGLPGAVAGIAFLPGQANGDGVFIRHDVFGAPNVSCSSGGTMNTLGTYDNGRITVHEVGHYLGVPHVFSGNGCTDSDIDPPGPFAIQDTPNQNNNSGPCPSISDCNSVPEDCPATPTSFYSYMDYSNDDCMVMFTEDQSAVINYWGTLLPWKSDAIFCNGVTNEYTCVTAPTCSDNIKNQGEEGVDCGGPCSDCVNTCGTSSYDPGGLCGFYENQSSEVVTICPDNPSELLNIAFTAFEIEEKDNDSGCWDWLKVYAGSSITDAQLGGEYCGYSIQDAPGGGSLFANAPGDCFTFEFFSDVSVVKLGWSANIICEFVLPVELVNFKATTSNNDVVLNWETESELNNVGFEILRREGESGSYKKIGFVAGAGTNNSMISYTYLDQTVFQNINYYYKLKQVDSDGSTNVSNTVSAIIKGDQAKYLLHPNPANGDLIEIRFLNKPSSNYTVELYDLQGKRLLYKDCQKEEREINISNIPSGVYLVKILKGNQLFNVERLLRLQ